MSCNTSRKLHLCLGLRKWQQVSRLFAKSEVCSICFSLCTWNYIQKLKLAFKSASWAPHWMILLFLVCSWKFCRLLNLFHPIAEYLEVDVKLICVYMGCLSDWLNCWDKMMGCRGTLWILHLHANKCSCP